MTDRSQKGINLNDSSTLNTESVTINMSASQSTTGRTGVLNNLGARGISPDHFVGRDQ